MQVRRQINRLFSSLKRKKSKRALEEEADDIDPVETPTKPNSLNKLSALRSSLRLKLNKENSTSRCQLLDDELNGDNNDDISPSAPDDVQDFKGNSKKPITTRAPPPKSHSENNDDIPVQKGQLLTLTTNNKTNSCLPQHQVQAELQAYVEELEGFHSHGDQDANRILFYDSPQQPSTSSNKSNNAAGKVIVTTKTLAQKCLSIKKLKGVRRKKNKLEKMESSPSTAQMRPNYCNSSIPTGDGPIEPCLACKEREQGGISIRAGGSRASSAASYSPFSGDNSCNPFPTQQQENFPQPVTSRTATVVETASPNTTTTVAIVSNNKLTWRAMRKSAKQIRKAMKVGFINWAESASYQYSAAVIPEIYECSPTASSSYYDDNPWISQHPHYRVREPYNPYLNLNANPNQICQHMP